MNRSLLLTRSITKVAASSVISLVLWAFAPILIGWAPVAITSGSMAPTVRPGDIVVTSPVDDPATLAVGDVVTYRQPGNDRRVTHRIDHIEDDGTIFTRGDANRDRDSDPLTPDRVEGRARVLVPYAGLATVSPTARSVVAISLLLVAATRWRARRGRPSNGPATSAGAVDVATAASGASAQPLWTAGIGPRLATRRRRHAATAAVALLAAAGMLPVSAVAAFTGLSAQPGSFSADVVAPPGNLDATAACNATAAEVTVTWDTSTTTDVDGYVLSRADNGGPASTVATVDAATTRWVDTSPPDGTVTYTAHATRAPWQSTDAGPATVTVPTC